MRDPEALPRSVLAYENPEFLNSADGRIIRILSEYSEPLARFRRERIRDTVVFFGSARFHAAQEDAPDEAAGNAAQSRAQFYENARQLAFLHARWAQTLSGAGSESHHRFVVCSGGGPGIMEAVNRGAYEAGCKSIGLNIRLPSEQEPNRYITPELSLDFHYFFMRKYWFAYLAKALVVFPGGFGTLDELFEILTLAQTGKLAKNIPVILYCRKYWEGMLRFDALAEAGAIGAKDLELFRFAETPEEAFATLQAQLRMHHLQPGADEEQGNVMPEIAHTRR